MGNFRAPEERRRRQGRQGSEQALEEDVSTQVDVSDRDSNNRRMEQTAVNYRPDLASLDPYSPGSDLLIWVIEGRMTVLPH